MSISLSPITRAIVKRDIKSWYGNPAGYVFIAIFAMLSAVFLFSEAFFQHNIADLSTLNEVFPRLLVILIPAITMGAWAGEKAQGTDELLLTMPARNIDIVLGKYLAVAGIYTIALLFTIPQVIMLMFLGNPDGWLLLSNYFGFWVLGLALLGTGMLGSHLSDNLTVAYIAGALLCSLVVFMEDIIGLLLSLFSPGLGDSWLLNFPVALFSEMTSGIISFASVAMFAGLIATFVYMNLMMMSRRNWKSGQGVHQGIRFLSLVTMTIAVTLLFANFGTRIDMTSAKIHSLSQESAELIKELDENRPVSIEAYLSKDVPREYVQHRRDLINLLRQFDAMAGDAIRVRIIDTELYSEEARAAKENYGIVPTTLFGSDEAGKKYDVFMGLSFTCGIEEEVIPFLYNKLPVEYELTRSIRVVSKSKRKKLGVLVTDVNLFGGFEPGRGSIPKWEIVKELELQYDVVQVAAGEDYPDDLDVLLAPMASSLEQSELDRLDRYVGAGGATLLIDDPMPRSAPGTSPSDPKKGANPNPMMGMMGQQPGQKTKGNFLGLLNKYGIIWNTRIVTWDSYLPHPQLSEQVPPEFVFVGHKSGAQNPFNPNQKASSGLQEILTMWGGAVRSGERGELRFAPLLQSSPVSGTVRLQDLVRRSFFGMSMNPNPPRQVEGGQTLACRVTGKGPEGKDVDLIFIADLDMVSSIFFDLRRQDIPGLDLNFDNVTFVLNCVDDLAGDDDFIDLRKRRPHHRTLETIEEATQEFQEEWAKEKEKAEAEAKDALAAANKRLQDAVAAIENDKGMDARSKDIRIESIREIEQRKLSVTTAKIEDLKRQQIDEAKATLVNHRRSIESSFAWIGMVIPPLLAVFVGLMIFMRKSKREKNNVPGTRSVGGVA